MIRARLGLVVWLGGVACDSAGQAPELIFEHAADEAWSPRAGPIAAPIGDLLLVTNNRDDTVSYVDLGLDPPAEIMKLPVGLQPIEREGPPTPDGARCGSVSTTCPAAAALGPGRAPPMARLRSTSQRDVARCGSIGRRHVA